MWKFLQFCAINPHETSSIFLLPIRLGTKLGDAGYLISEEEKLIYLRLELMALERTNHRQKNLIDT